MAKLFVCCSLLVSVQPVHAADYFSPWDGYPPIVDWSGLYVGLNAGFGSAHASASATLLGFPVSAAQDLNGALGGGQIGYNWQLGRTVLGIEADAQVTGERKDELLCGASYCGSEIHLTDKILSFGTVRARVGFTWERLLIYGTGGFGYVQWSSTVSAGNGNGLVDVGGWDNTRLGWTAGVGVEFQIDPHWSTKLEYLYFDTGSFEATVDAGILGTYHPTVRAEDQIVRAGFNYHF